MANRKQIPFKSPLCPRQSETRVTLPDPRVTTPDTRVTTPNPSVTPSDPRDVTAKQRQRLAELQTEINQLEMEGYKECELATHIDKLHEYNEIKDVGQVILGQIANLEGVRTKDLYEKYGLKLDD